MAVSRALPYHGPGMRIGKFSFQPRLIPTLVTAALLPVLVGLGFWQLDRADQKFEARAVREQRMQQPPRPLSGDDISTEAMFGRRVEVHGRFDLQHQFLLQNQRYRERPGYQVYTPLRLDEHTGVLVDRGWVQAWFGENAPEPDLDGAEGPLRFDAAVDTPPSIGLKLGEPGAGATDWPRQVQYIDTEWAGRQLGYTLLPYVLLPEALPAQQLERNHRPGQIGERGMPPEKHVSYAVQWFALALALLVIYIAVNTRRSNRRNNDK